MEDVPCKDETLDSKYTSIKEYQSLGDIEETYIEKAVIILVSEGALNFADIEPQRPSLTIKLLEKLGIPYLIEGDTPQSYLGFLTDRDGSVEGLLEYGDVVEELDSYSPEIRLFHDEDVFKEYKTILLSLSSAGSGESETGEGDYEDFQMKLLELSGAPKEFRDHPGRLASIAIYKYYRDFLRQYDSQLVEILDEKITSAPEEFAILTQEVNPN